MLADAFAAIPGAAGETGAEAAQPQRSTAIAQAARYLAAIAFEYTAQRAPEKAAEQRSAPVVKGCPLLLLLALWGCASASPYVTTVGALKPGTTMTVLVDRATVNAYQPAAGQPRSVFTISATAQSKGPQPAAPRLHPGPNGIVVSAPPVLASLLVRVPDGVQLVVDSHNGDVNVTDITGNARITADRGNVTVMLPGYAQAAVGEGNIAVTMGATDWPGTLHFCSGHGDVELWINPKAAFSVHLHTDNGTLFTDFGLRGTSQGGSETIDGSRQRRRPKPHRRRDEGRRDPASAPTAAGVSSASSASRALISRTIASLYGVGVPVRRPNATTAPLM